GGGEGRGGGRGGGGGGGQVAVLGGRGGPRPGRGGGRQRHLAEAAGRVVERQAREGRLPAGACQLGQQRGQVVVHPAVPVDVQVADVAVQHQDRPALQRPAHVLDPDGHATPRLSSQAPPAAARAAPPTGSSRASPCRATRGRLP